MSKVNWSAKSSHEYVGNYKLLQKAFTKNKVQRYVDVDKLIRGKYQDNLEFCQWLKAFFDMQNGGVGGREDYDPVAVRAKGKGGKTVPAGGGAGKSSSNSRARGAPVRTSSSMSSSSGGRKAPVVGKARIGSSSATTTTTAARAAPSPRRMASSSSSATSTTSSSAARSSRPGRERPVSTQKENTSATNLPATSRKSTTPAVAATSSSVSNTAQVQKYKEEITTLKSQNTTLQTQFSQLQLLSTELEMNLSTVETERDFYFEKLRGIEVMLQVYKEQEEERGDNNGDGEMMKRVIDKIFKVMYAAAEDNVVVDDDGNVSFVCEERECVSFLFVLIVVLMFIHTFACT